MSKGHCRSSSTRNLVAATGRFTVQNSWNDLLSASVRKCNNAAEATLSFVHFLRGITFVEKSTCSGFMNIREQWTRSAATPDLKSKVFRRVASEQSLLVTLSCFLPLLRYTFCNNAHNFVTPRVNSLSPSLANFASVGPFISRLGYGGSNLQEHDADCLRHSGKSHFDFTHGVVICPQWHRHWHHKVTVSSWLHV